MKLFIIDFIDNTGGWYTYDVDGCSLLDAACNLMRGNPDFKITAIKFKRNLVVNA